MPSLIQDLKNGKIANIYLFYGEEAFKRLYFRDALKEAVLKGDLMNYSAFEGKDINWQAVYDDVQTLPFFADRRLVVVENSGKFKAGKEDGEESGKGTSKKQGGSIIERIIEDLPATTCLAFFEESAAKNKRIFKEIVKKGIAVECAPDKEEEVISWLAKGFAAAGKKVRRSTLQLLTERTGLSYDRLRTEVEKIIGYCGEKTVVEDADVLAVSSQNIESRIFDLLRAMSEKNTKKVLDLYYDLLTNREHPLYILAMLRSQLRTMLQVAELDGQGMSAPEIAKAAGKPVFVVNNTRKYLRYFSRDQIISFLDEINETDQNCKSGLIKDQIGVELLLIRFSGIHPENR